jgi:hypothetical protein
LRIITDKPILAFMSAEEIGPHADVPNRRFNQMFFGLIGGLVGALIMGLVAYLTPPPSTGGNPFFIAAASLIGSGNLAWGVGWLLHVLTGMSLGAIFGLLATRGSLGTRKIGNKLLLGVVVGLVAWTVLFVPLMVILNPASLSTEALGGGLLFNITFGVIMAVVFAIGQSFMMVESVAVSHDCEVCSLHVSTDEELRDHMHEKHPALTQKHVQAQHAVA